MFLNESGTDDAECRRKIAIRRKGTVAIRSLVNAKGLQFKSERALNETLLMTVLL